MLGDHLEERSAQLAGQVDALATALVESGVAEEVASRLLASASAAVLQALALDELMTARPSEPVAASVPDAQPRAPSVEPTIPLAA